MAKVDQYTSIVSSMKNREYLWQKLEKCPRDSEPWTPHVPPLTYFNNNKQQHGNLCPYDMVFNIKDGYNQRIHRCDMRDLDPIHENIFQEEKDKPVPALTSLLYGRPCRPLLEKRETRFGKVTAVKTFASRNGTNMDSDLGDVPF